MNWQPVGRIASVHRYPVKSMAGEALESATLEAGGIVGDRRCALVDVATGRVASAKNPRLYAPLLDCAARTRLDGAIEIVLPDARTIGAPDAGSALSALLGRSVAVAFARPDGIKIERIDPEAAADTDEPVAAVLPLGIALPDRGFADFAPLHCLTTGSLAMVAAGGGTARYRPNLVIDSGNGGGFVENAWVGRRLRIGAVEVEVILPTPRCAVPTLAAPGIAAAPGIPGVLRRLNRLDVPGFGRLACLGVYARIVTAGSFEVGDTVQIDATPA